VNNIKESMLWVLCSVPIFAVAEGNYKNMGKDILLSFENYAFS